MSTQLLQTHQLHTQCKLATSCVAMATVVLGPSKYALLLSWTYWHGLNNTLTIHELHDFWFKHVKSEQTLQELVCQQIIQTIPVSAIVLAVHVYVFFYYT